MGLFDLVEREDRTIKYGDWRPPEPPVLGDIKELVIDFETDGLKYWAGDRAGGVAYYTPDGRNGYLPWAHQGDPANLDEAVVKRWIQTELKNKRITCANAKTEV